MKSQVGIIGLGRMGKNIALNLGNKKFEVIGFDLFPQAMQEMARRGIISAKSFQEVCRNLKQPRKILLMVPAGNPVDNAIKALLPFLSRGDILIDGGNSFYRDSIKRSKFLKKHGVEFLDMGTSGGIEGACHGASLTIGGAYDAYKKCEALFKAIAAKNSGSGNGYLYVGKNGAGHYVKMVHNGIEYGLLQAYGEGFETLATGPYKLDFEKIASVWNNGSVVRSWLLELIRRAFSRDAKLSKIMGVVGGGETGAWALKTAQLQAVEPLVLAASLKARKLSKKNPTFGGKVIAATRNEFGGHAIMKAKK